MVRFMIGTGLLDLGGELLSWVDYVVPIMLLVISIIGAASTIRWGKKLASGVHEIMSNPWKIIFWVIFLVALLFIWFYVRSFIKI